MTVQVNARLPDDIAAALERWASKLGIEKSALARDLITEGIQALAEGRASFERPETPGPADLARLVAKLDGQTTELDRVLRHNAKRDAELARRAQGDARGLSDARDAIVAEVVAHMRAALEALRCELARTPEELAGLMGRLTQFREVHAKLDRIEKLSSEPRTKNWWRIGSGELSVSGGLFMMAMLSVPGLGMLLFLVKAIPSLGAPLGMSMLGSGDTAICRSIAYEYGTGECDIKETGAKVAVNATKPGSPAAARESRDR